MDSYPFLSIDELFSELKGAKHFSRLIYIMDTLTSPQQIRICIKQHLVVDIELMSVQLCCLASWICQAPFRASSIRYSLIGQIKILQYIQMATLSLLRQSRNIANFQQKFFIAQHSNFYILGKRSMYYSSVRLSYWATL